MQRLTEQPVKQSNNTPSKKRNKCKANNVKPSAIVIVKTAHNISPEQLKVLKDANDHATGGPRWCCLSRDKIFLPECKIHQWHYK